MDALPLMLFLAVFAGGCCFLEFRHILLFARPAAFVLTAASVWIWWMHLAGFGGLGRVRSLLALEVRLALAGLFVILLAEPRAVRTSDELSVVYAVDVSDSISDGSTTRALEFVAAPPPENPPKTPRDWSSSARTQPSSSRPINGCRSKATPSSPTR